MLYSYFIFFSELLLFFISSWLFIVRTGAEGRWRMDNMQQRAAGRLQTLGRCSENTTSSRFGRSTDWATRAALIIFFFFFSHIKTVFIAEVSCIFSSVLSWCTIWSQQQCYLLSGKPKVRQNFNISYCGSLGEKKKAFSTQKRFWNKSKQITVWLFYCFSFRFLFPRYSMGKVTIFLFIFFNVLFELIGAPSLSKMTKNGCPPNYVALYYPSAQPNLWAFNKGALSLTYVIYEK